MGNQHMKFCLDASSYSSGSETFNQNTIKINEFQLCKKGQIQGDKIEMEMIVLTHIVDDELLDDCKCLFYSVEIGELHERDKLQWTEYQDLDCLKKKKLEFAFKMNHIKQVIKVEIQGNYSSKSNPSGFILKTLFTGFFNFARCIKKSGQFIYPQQVGQKASDDIEVQVSLQEKYNQGGYRCISLKVSDTKGGDFVENPNFSMIVVEAKRHTIVAEIPKEIPLLSGPDGLYKRIEIGVNNYDSLQFMQQDFQVYFLKDSKDFSQYKTYESQIGKFEPINEIKSDLDILVERIDQDLIAFGQFSAHDLIVHSVSQENFTQEESDSQSKRTSSSKNVFDENDENDEISEYKLPLFNKEKHQQIGLITLRNIQCKKRTSFLDLIANQMLEIVPIIAVDFSMSNLTFDDRKCIHSNNEDNPNEYRDLLTSVSKAYRQISPSTLFYGFGANSVSKITEVSDLFVGTGDMLNPIVMTDHLESAYYSCLKKVELNLPVHLAQIIDRAIQFAQQSEAYFLQGGQSGTQYTHALTYFVLYIFETGIIDDIQETIQQLTRVLNLPLSIYIVNLQNKNLRQDDIDASNLEDKCKFLFERANRSFLKVIEYKDISTGGTQEVMQALTEKIPFEIEQYFDSVAAHSDQIKIQQNQVRKGLDLVREVIRQKEEFIESIEGEEGLTKENVNKLIEDFKLYEYSTESAQILLGLKKRIDKS